MSQLIATYHGQIRSDAFYFAPLINGLRVQGMVLDTGAFELTFNQRTARRLGLPNLGTLQIGGVGGTTRAYRSRCTIKMNGRIYRNVPCIVVPGLREKGLFGLRFFVDNRFTLQLNPTARTLTISKA